MYMYKLDYVRVHYPTAAYYHTELPIQYVVCTKVLSYVYNTRSENCTEVFPEGSTYGNNTFVRKYLSCTVSWKVRKYLRKLLVTRTVNKYFRTIFILKVVVLSYLRTKVLSY